MQTPSKGWSALFVCTSLCSKINVLGCLRLTPTILHTEPKLRCVRTAAGWPGVVPSSIKRDGSLMKPLTPLSSSELDMHFPLTFGCLCAKHSRLCLHVTYRTRGIWTLCTERRRRLFARYVACIPHTMITPVGTVVTPVSCGSCPIAPDIIGCRGARDWPYVTSLL
jgi:hypothetical protein